MGRRVIHISRSTAGISPITLFIIVAIVVVIGYVVLGRGPRGSQKTEITDEAPPPVEGSNSRDSSSRKSSRRQSSPSTPDPVQSDTDYPDTSDTEASYSGNESDISTGTAGGQGGGHAVGRKKKGILTHKRPQSERGRRGSISFIDDDKAASRLWRFDDEERPKEIWEEPVVFGGGMKTPPKDDFRLPHEQSRLHIFEAALLEGKHQDLLARMKEVESLVFTNWMEAGRPDASVGQREAWATRLATAESDSWGNTRRWGKLPTVVFDLCLALLRSKIINISTLAEVMYEEPHIRDCRSCPAKGIIEGGFEAVDVEQGDGQQKVRRLVPKNDEAAREILIGWFALPYRAYLREQWMDCRARVEAGYRLPESVIAALGTPSGDPGLGGEMLKWLSWAGQRYLVNRLFTLGGADLLDGTARISITRLDAGDDSLFKLDVTLFVPEATNLADFARAKAAADWMRNTKGVGKDGSAHGEGWKGSSYWLRDALHRCIHLSGSWIYANFKGQDQKVNQQEDRIALRRLFIRPGYSKTHIDMAKGRIKAQGPVKAYHDQKLSVLMQLPLDAVARAAKHREAVNAVKGMVDRSRFSIIRFTNQRQHSWYTPVEGATAADRFDPKQVAFMLGVMGPALGKGFYDDESTMEDEATYAITESNVSLQTELTPGAIHLDFGGILPYVAMTTEGQMKADFVWLKHMPRVRTYYLPLMAGAPIASRGESKLVYQGMGSLGKTSVQWCTARWALDRSTGIWAAMALWDDVERRTAFVVMVDSLEEGRRVLHQQLEGVFVYEVIDSLFVKGLEATEGGAIGQANQYQTSDGARRRVEIDLARMLYIISKALQLTTIGECSTGNDHPGVYLHLYTATAAQLLAKWDALPERRSQIAPPVVPEPAETPQPLAPHRNVGFAGAEGDGAYRSCSRPNEDDILTAVQMIKRPLLALEVRKVHLVWGPPHPLPLPTGPSEGSVVS
jgi:hypothetical protein